LWGFGIAGQPQYGTEITQNAFEGNLAAAMYFDNAAYTSVTENTSEGDGSFVVFSESGNGMVFSHNRGRDFGGKESLPIYGSAKADAAIDLIIYNEYLQINDNDLEGGKLPGYNGIAFSSTLTTPEFCCENCQVSHNRIRRFAGNGIVAEEGSSPTLEESLISLNVVEDNGNDGILIENATGNQNNVFFDNKAEGNHVLDCVDNTSGALTLSTYDTWHNNAASLSYPRGLCTSGWR
jgi:hypothetical protein